MHEISPLTRILGFILILLLSFIGINKLLSKVANPSIPTDVILTLNDYCVPCHSGRQSAAYNRRTSVGNGTIVNSELTNISSLRYDNMKELSNDEINRIKELTLKEILNQTMPRKPKMFHEDFQWSEKDREILLKWAKSK